MGIILGCRAAGSSSSPTATDASLVPAQNTVDSAACGPDAPTLETAADSSEVDKQARARPRGPSPQYPPDLRDQGVQGDVRILFVVDTLGNAEMCTVRVVASSHPVFTQAVLKVLPRMRFFPAEKNGRKVRQRLVLPMMFRISSPLRP
jgi:TonB family protein